MHPHISISTSSVHLSIDLLVHVYAFAKVNENWIFWNLLKFRESRTQYFMHHAVIPSIMRTHRWPYGTCFFIYLDFAFFHFFEWISVEKWKEKTENQKFEVLIQIFETFEIGAGGSPQVLRACRNPTLDPAVAWMPNYFLCISMLNAGWYDTQWDSPQISSCAFRC